MTKQGFVFAVALASTVSIGAAPVARADLIGSYTFEEGSGTVVRDLSGRGNHGVLVNPRADTWTSGHSGGGLFLPGIPGTGATYVDLGDPADFRLSTKFTFAAWVYSTAPDTDAPVLAKEDWNPVTAYWFGVFYGGFGTLLTTEGTCCWDFDRRSLPVPAWNGWNHIASTWDGKVVRQYLNGLLVDEKPFAGPISDTRARLTIGINSGVWTTAFTGTVDDIQIYNHDLSAAEISRLGERAVTGCVNLQGTPLANAKVMLKQDTAKQTTVTDGHGCYDFKTITSGQTFKIEIAGPVVP